MSEQAASLFLAEVSLNEKPMSKIRILHVDDDPGILEVSKQILEVENNFEVDTALSVEEAFKRMEKQSFDVVVSDYQMPQKNGLQFLQELREKRNRIPFIMFTGKSREEVAVEALNLGADRYLNKHGSPETVYCELADAINKTVEQRKSRKLLAASESKYRMLVEKSLQGILVTKVAPLRLIFANDTMGKILGYSSQELMSLSPERIMGLVYHEDRAVFFKRLENRFRGEPAESCLEFRAVRKDGSIIWLDALSSRVECDGQPAVQGMFLDVNERKKAEEVLRRSEEKYRELANFLPEIVFEADLTGKVTFFSQRALETTGYTREELEKGLNMLQFVVPEEREKAKENIRKSISGKDLGANEYTLFRKNGATYPALVRTTPIFSENKVTGLRGLVIDITERKKATESLEKEQRELDSIVDSSPIIIFYKDKEGKFIRVNKTFAETLKIPKEEFLGKTVFDLYSAKIAQDMANDDSEVLKSGHPKLGIIEQYESASGIRWVQTDKVPIFDKNGIPAGLVGFAQDITERKLMDTALQKSNERFKQVMKHVEEFVWEVDAAGLYTYVNSVVEKMLGYKPEEVVGKKRFYDFFHPDDEEELKKKAFSVLDKKDSFKGLINRNVARNGSIVWLSTSGVPIVADDGKLLGYRGVDVNITERKKAEATLRQSEERYRSLFENSIDGVMISQPDGAILSANPAACRMLGMSEEELKKAGREGIVVKDEKLTTALQERERTGNMRADLTFRRKDGTTFVGEVSSGVFTDAEGIIKTSLIFRDVTERKKAEEALDQVMDQLVLVNEKVEVVGSLTRHDVRNKLSTMTGYAYLLKKKHADQADIVDGLGKMEQAVKDIAAIFDFAKMYEQLGVEELKYINAEKAVNEAIALFSGSSSLEFINDCHGLSLLADSLLTRLFYNLIDNSLKHGEKVTKIRAHYEKADQDELIVVFEDDGVGISAENKSKLFKEGFSTSGTSGYGLFLLRKMMSVYGWSIQENGEPGKGAKFTMTIPRINQNGKENFQIA